MQPDEPHQSSRPFARPFPPPTLRASTFRDALGLAMWLADDYAYLNASVLLDRRRRVLDLAAVEGVGCSVEPLVERLTDSPPRPSPSVRSLAVEVMLITVRPVEADIVREADLWRYRRAGWALARVGLSLIDWIESDGDLFRSFAHTTCPASAWPDDAAAEGSTDWSSR